jgi:glutamate/tyrosine decarboxylase-like PLP-dependent enzyme
MNIERRVMPEAGLPADEVLQAMEQLRDGDVRWRDGKAWSLVFHAGDEISQFLKQAYTMFFSENGLNPAAFPSLRRFEVDVVSMVGGLLGGDERVVGNMTSGGTESIMMAVKTAREWGRKHKPLVRRPEMVLPVSAHPAFDKAAHYFGVKPVKVPVGPDFRARVRAVKRAINWRTVLLVGSAVSYPQGVVDPIAELAGLAKKKKILMHVDACVGGMMLPFVRSLGYPVPPFDFAVDGVTSISVDLHKYGYAAKPASVVLYRDKDLRKHQYYAYTDWPGGIYVSPTMTGTRPGGAIAAAWAILNRLGFSGYREIAAEVMQGVQQLRAGVAEIDGVEVLGDPVMSLLALGSDEVDIYEVGDQMQDRGWHMDRQQRPPSLHLTVNRGHLQSVPAFLSDLRESVEASRRDPRERMIEKGKLMLLNAALRVLPSWVVSKATRMASGVLGLDGGELPQRTAPMYGLMGALPNRGDLQTMVIDLLDKMTRPDAPTGQ